MELARDDEQAALWNGPAGRAWVETQDLLDHMFRPLQDRLVEAASLQSTSRVLDVGCGTGSLTLAVGRLIGASGRCTGIDISHPMIVAATARAEREGVAASFICADAQAHGFAPAGFDRIVSRLGVMFFKDPVRAFANLRCAATSGAELRFVAWRSAAENPFMTTAERAAVPLLPDLPARRPGGPGQFAFADPERIGAILQAGGWAGSDIVAVDVVCTFPAAELDRYLTRLGPVGVVLETADARTRSRVIDSVRPAFDAYVHGDEVRYTAACWMVGAHATSAPAGARHA